MESRPGVSFGRVFALTVLAGTVTVSPASAAPRIGVSESISLDGAVVSPVPTSHSVCGDGVCSPELGEDCENCADCLGPGTSVDVIQAGETYVVKDDAGGSEALTATSSVSVQAQTCLALPGLLATIRPILDISPSKKNVTDTMDPFAAGVAIAYSDLVCNSPVAYYPDKCFGWPLGDVLVETWVSPPFRPWSATALNACVSGVVMKGYMSCLGACLSVGKLRARCANVPDPLFGTVGECRCW